MALFSYWGDMMEGSKMSKNLGKGVKLILLVNVILAVLIWLISAWTTWQTALIFPILSAFLWLIVASAMWNVLVAIALVQLAYDLYSNK